jgi:hypothetical protein
MQSWSRLNTGACFGLSELDEDIDDDLFNKVSRQVAATGANCITYEAMVLQGAKGCYTLLTIGYKCPVANELRPGHASGSCLLFEAVNVRRGETNFDFKHGRD